MFIRLKAPRAIHPDSDDDFPAVAAVIAFERNSVSGAVGELHLIGIPVETGVVDVTHVTELTENGSARADFGGRNRLLAGNRTLDKVKHLVFALVKLDGGLVEGLNALDVGDSPLKPGVLLDGRGRSVIGSGVTRFKNASF